jgi:hypothetical protein
LKPVDKTLTRKVQQALDGVRSRLGRSLECFPESQLADGLIAEHPELWDAVREAAGRDALRRLAGRMMRSLAAVPNPRQLLLPGFSLPRMIRLPSGWVAIENAPVAEYQGYVARYKTLLNARVERLKIARKDAFRKDREILEEHERLLRFVEPFADSETVTVGTALERRKAKRIQQTRAARARVRS